MFFPRKMNRALITWFGCGHAPFAPGTAGSVGALPLCWALAMYVPLPVRIVIAVGFTAIAVLAAAQDQIDAKAKDPCYVVIDEVCGMLWTTLLAPPAWAALLAGFVLFRLFDVLKPFPANLFDRSSKTSSSWFRRGTNIVLDDVVAGFYSLLIGQVLFAYILSAVGNA